MTAPPAYLRPRNSQVQWSPGAAGPLLRDDILALLGAGPDEDLSWQDSALCAQADPDAWFPERPNPEGVNRAVRQAKAVCAACEVRAECLAYALEHNERHGVWGGLTEHERRRLKQQAA